MTGIEKAIAALAERDTLARPGGAEVLAERLGVSQQAVSGWKAKGWVPAGRAKAISDMTKVPMRELVHPNIAELFA